MCIDLNARRFESTFILCGLRLRLKLRPIHKLRLIPRLRLTQKLRLRLVYHGNSAGLYWLKFDVAS